ncbi:MAG: hypothetical protein AAFR59_12085 [Bacteroidota bacterium]
MRNIVLGVGIILLGLLSACSSSTASQEERGVPNYSGPQVGDTLVINHDLLSKLNIPLDTKASDKSSFKIFSWIKAGCASCALKFKRWIDFIENNQIIGSYELYPIVYASSRDMVSYTVEDVVHFSYPVYFDSTNHFFEENQLSEDGYFQTFLVDEHNKVLVVGDPNLDNGYLKTYQRIINGE